MPSSNIRNVCLGSAEIQIKGNYYDIFGQEFKTDIKINTKEFIDNAKALHVFFSGNEIAYAIEKVEKELHSCSNEIAKMKPVSDEKLTEIRDILDKIEHKIEPNKAENLF